MSRVSKSRKTVQYHVTRNFSNQNQICEEQILAVFQKYYTDKRNIISKINTGK